MTVLSRGARTRRGGRRPGWLLLTVLLVLAIAASSALVFTNRVELLKLAVILALWAAVVGAFVSVIYRRQSDADQAKARDLKMVYDLQLDREISARREYELTVETHLRRELASELRAQAADEVAALRAELAALRTNLEILFDTDLAQRPAIETERGYAQWAGSAEVPRPDRVASSRVTAAPVDDDTTRTAESPIIDVPEEPLAPPVPRGPVDENGYRGSHRLPSDDPGWAPPGRPAPQPQPQQRPEPDPHAWNPPTPPPPPPQQPIAMPAAAGASENGQRDPRGRQGPPAAVPPPENRGRHSVFAEGAPPPSPPPPPRVREPVPEPLPVPGSGTPVAPAPRHRNDEAPDPAGPPTGGQSVAELLARLQAGTTTGGGRRRRRED
jgi:hypothetical protein